MALFTQINNYVKLRTSPLTINGVANTADPDYERIHITKFNFDQDGHKTVSFYDGGRSVLVINGDAEASAYDNKTVAQIITAAEAFEASLQE